MESSKLMYSHEELESKGDNDILEHFGVTCMRYVHGEVSHRYVSQVKSVILQRLSLAKEKGPARQR